MDKGSVSVQTPACCLDGSCQNHCSITSSWPGCGDIGNFNGHHSRICPCEFLEPPPPGSWIEYRDCDCHNGYGGTNIIPHPVVDPQTLDNCKSVCLATKDCSGVVFGKPNAPYPGCHLRKDVEAQNCRKSSNYNLYIFTDVCAEPKGVTGPCEAIIPMWTYDKFSRKCEKFIYGGCQGNGNRFQSKAECEQKCDVLQGKSCFVGGVRREDGWSGPCGDGCNSCGCRDGLVVTTFIECPKCSDHQSERECRQAHIDHPGAKECEWEYNNYGRGSVRGTCKNKFGGNCGPK